MSRSQGMSAALGFVISGLVGCQTEPVQVARVEQADIRQYVDEQGKTRLPKVILITMPYEAQLEPIELEPGDSVAAGEVVAQVAAGDLDDAFAEAQASVERIRKSIAESEDQNVEETGLAQANKFVDAMQQAVVSAQESMRASKERRDFTKDEAERIARLNAQGARTETELEQARLAAVEADVQYEKDELTYASMLSIQAATNLLPNMIENYMERQRKGTAVLRQQLAEAEARLRQMQTRKQRGSMVSPVAGVVLNRMIDNKRLVAPGTVLLEIGRLDRLQVEADILSEDVVEIREGDRAVVYGPTLGADAEEGEPATVFQIYPAGFTKLSSLGVEQQRVKVVLAMETDVVARIRESRQVGPDYRVRVRIFTDEREDALVLPRTALFRGPAGGWQVFAVVNGQARRRDVEVGLMNDEYAEIRDGLAAGELAILAPESSVRDGVAVSFAPVE